MGTLVKENDVIERRNYLIKQLNSIGIYETSDGRRLEDVSLYTLEWNHVTAKIEAAKAYGEGETHD